jgi:hypothetical protein
LEIASVIVKTAAGAPAAELVLRAGADVVVRVQEAPPDGGRGLLALAGRLLAARLPPGLAPGQTLPVRVVEASEQQVVLRVREDAGARVPDSGAHAAGALAVSGDPQLVRVATNLVPPELALPLPNGDALTLTVDPDAGGGDEDGRDGEADGEAAFVLHSAELGPIAVRLRLAGGAVSAAVSVDEAALPLAQAAAPELVSALRDAVGGSADVVVSGRGAATPRPAPPRVAEGLDAYA